MIITESFLLFLTMITGYLSTLEDQNVNFFETITKASEYYKIYIRGLFGLIIQKVLISVL
jgi:hypothetical protein